MHLSSVLPRAIVVLWLLVFAATAFPHDLDSRLQTRAEFELERDLTIRYAKRDLIPRYLIDTDSNGNLIRRLHPRSELEVRLSLARRPRSDTLLSAENGKRSVGPAHPEPQPKIPTVGQLENFLMKRNPGAATRMVFWSGVGEGEAKDFATAHSRYTMEMLISNLFTEYTAYGPDKVYRTFADTLPFWKNASEAAARFAQGEVWVYINPAGCANKGSVWMTVEKPIIKAKGLKLVTYDDRGRILSGGC
ncbi:hypothetical protein MMC11_005485 [Xylographa trunciseda]|nr:hypothetical protein [Xylographa trunciseda]